MEKDTDFDTLVQNAMLYGTGVLLMDFKDGSLHTRVVPIEEYTETGEQLKWIDQSTKETR
jgi:hypothetical protein